jgi:hypothetical protein
MGKNSQFTTLIGYHLGRMILFKMMVIQNAG